MSIELPEAHVLTIQMNDTIKGRQVATVATKHCEKLQKLGFFNKSLKDYELIVGEKVISVISKGAVILVKFGGGKNLLLAPEYGGRILFHPKDAIAPERFHFKTVFTDGTFLTVALSGFGCVQMLIDDDLGANYVYKRDFSDTPSPITEEFKFSAFKEALSNKNLNVKTIMVGKEAIVVGLGNSLFQDVLFRAGIHPKRKASDLSNAEALRLFHALEAAVQERISLGGKNQFVDLFGKSGKYEPLMGSNMKGLSCKKCGSTVKAMSLGGGQVFFCPRCQN